MENENKDKNIILTDEQLKEVAGGIISPFNTLAEIKARKCNNYKLKECFESDFCVWKNGKCVLKTQ